MWLCTAQGLRFPASGINITTSSSPKPPILSHDPAVTNRTKMGRTDENEEPPAGSPESEEMLPLYHESTPFNAAEELKAPDPKATPDEVRDYLVQAMQRRGVGIDHARRIAACWTIGNGQELRAYPVQMYRDIFGAGDAWVVYKAVKGQIYKEENEKDPNYRLGMRKSKGRHGSRCMAMPS